MLPPEQMRQLFHAVETAKRTSVTWVQFEDAHHMDAYFVAQHVRCSSCALAFVTSSEAAVLCCVATAAELAYPCHSSFCPHQLQASARADSPVQRIPLVRRCPTAFSASHLPKPWRKDEPGLQEYWPALMEFLRQHGCMKAPGEVNTDSEPEYEDLSGETFDDDVKVRRSAELFALFALC